MEIKLVNQVNSRWADGRTFAGMPGRRVTVDDTDADAVAHMRHLIAVGDAVEVEVAPEPKTVDPLRPTGMAADPEVADKIHKPARGAKAGAE